jgi:FKBP-type peptidyl-prolyl cis-trans isomerase SlyD
VPRSEFPAEIPLEPGVILHLRDNDDDVYETTVVSVNKDTVRLTFNHPLAGKELHFSVTVLAVREATPEELEHGHVHEH